MEHRLNRRGRSLAIAALASLTLAGFAGCSSGSDGPSSDASGEASSDTSGEAPADAADEVTETSPASADAGTESSDTVSSDDGGDESAESAECGGLTAAAITAAVGAGDFDSAADVSIDADTSCVFTNSMSVYGVSVSKESTSTYLAGDLEGRSDDEALSLLESLLTSFVDDPTVTRVDVGGNAAIIVTGTSLTGGPAGQGAAVVDGVVISVDADGSELATDPAGFEPIVTNLLALATSS